jgi:hypothetical protein
LEIDVCRDVELRSEWKVETLMEFAMYDTSASSSPLIVEVAAGCDVNILWLGTGPPSGTFSVLQLVVCG